MLEFVVAVIAVELVAIDFAVLAADLIVLQFRDLINHEDCLNYLVDGAEVVLQAQELVDVQNLVAGVSILGQLTLEERISLARSVSGESVGEIKGVSVYM